MPQQTQPEGPGRRDREDRRRDLGYFLACIFIAAFMLSAASRAITRARAEQVGVSPNGCPITYIDLGGRGDAFVLICPKGARP